MAFFCSLLRRLTKVFEKNIRYQQSELLGEAHANENAHYHCDTPMLQNTTVNERNNIIFIDLDSLTSNPANTFKDIDQFDTINIGTTVYAILAVIHNKQMHFTTTFKIHDERFYYDDKNGKVTNQTHKTGSCLAAALFVKKIQHVEVFI